MGGLLTLPSFLARFPEINVQNPPLGSSSGFASNLQGITVGGYTLGCFFGAVATIWLGNLLGRKWTIIVGSSIMVVGAAIQAGSFSLGQLIASRLITGFGNGTVVTSCSRKTRWADLDRHEHFDCADLAIRDLEVTPPRPDGHDRRIAYRFWCHVILLVGPRFLVPRAERDK